jgi:NTE family protein
VINDKSMVNPSPPASGPKVGLILGGGGARAAYQVGVLKAIATMLPPRSANPFRIICGTSAGAINAAGLASNAAQFQRAVALLMRSWSSLHAQHVYRTDPRSVLYCGMRCLAGLIAGGLQKSRPVSLLDSAPLGELLERTIDFTGIGHSIENGHLDALCVTASSYTSGESISFFQGHELLLPWKRARRVGRRTEIGVPHVLASCALPFCFPAARIDDEHFGDGSMYQLAPISAALHLGAERVLVIGVGQSANHMCDVPDASAWPSLAHIAGHVLDAIFIDTLDMDLERLQRINQTINLIPAEVRAQDRVGLRTVDTLVLRPSESLDRIAGRCAHALPRTIRYLMRGLGAMKPNGARALSYLLFEGAYCRQLLRLGIADGMAQRASILSFLGHGGAPAEIIRFGAGDAAARSASK